MTIQELTPIVRELSPDDMYQLYLYLGRLLAERTVDGQLIEPPAWDLVHFHDVLAQLRAGISEDEFADIEQAMNDEYIEDVDDLL